jgi:hypothetical protein
MIAVSPPRRTFDRAKCDPAHGVTCRDAADQAQADQITQDLGDAENRCWTGLRVTICAALGSQIDAQ